MALLLTKTPFHISRSGRRAEDRSARLCAYAQHNSERDADYQIQRRAVSGLLGFGLLSTFVKPSEAAFGDAARVFGGKPTNDSGFIPYQGGDFSLLLPARWNATLERDQRDVRLRYEDTYPANNLLVYAKKTSKNSITDFGDPEKFLKDISFLFGISLWRGILRMSPPGLPVQMRCSLWSAVWHASVALTSMFCTQSYPKSRIIARHAGDNVWQGQTRSEGGFKPGQVSNASILDADSVTGKDGKPHYNLHVLTRSADGNEGGKHHIISAAVSGGQLYIMKCQVGDKRWNKGGSRDSKMLQDSFKVV